MQEQERPKELPIQFPRVKLETIRQLESLAAHNPENFVNESVELIKSEDPFLFEGLFIYTNEIEDDQLGEFFSGATFVFRALREEGIKLPPVSMDTVRTFWVEMVEVDREFQKYPESEGVEFFRRKLKESELGEIPFDPCNYAEENPYLMVYIADNGFEPKGSITPFGEGAMAVYGYKRRQWSSEQLKMSPFGG